MVSISKIQALLDQVFGTPTVPLGMGDLQTLRDLARECGATEQLLDVIGDADLKAIWSTCKRRPESGPLVIERLNRAHIFWQPAPFASSSDVSMDRIEKEIQKRIDALSTHIVHHEDLRREVSALRAMQTQLGDSMGKQVASMVREALKQSTATELTVTFPATAQVVEIGTCHFQVPNLIKAIAAGVNVYLHGPAGSGKTTACQQVADAFGLQFYFAAKVESEYNLLGFKDARGETVRTQFRDAYEHGGVFLFDEMDASAASAIVALNAALANGVCPFPDGIIKRHADFKCIGAGNTVLTGATLQYQGRSALDGASTDRFAFMQFSYDENLERKLATNSTWCQHVQAIRKVVADRGLVHLVTPRATYDGCKLLDAGFTWDAVEDMCIFKGLDSATVKQLRDAVGNPLINAGSASHA